MRFSAPRLLTGFTLVETVVIIALYALILVALATLFTTFNRLYRYQQASVAAAQGAGAAMTAIHAAVIPADAILASHVFASGTRTSATTTLVLELPAMNASGQVIAGSYDYVAFYASSTEFYRLTEAAAGSVRPSGKKLLTSLLSAVSFTYDNIDISKASSVTADITASTTLYGVSTAAHRRETLYYRN